VPLTVEHGEGNLSTDPGCAEEIVLSLELDRDSSYGGHIFHNTILTVELVDSDSEQPLPEGRTAWWSARRLPHGTTGFRRGERIRLREGSTSIQKEFFFGDYEIKIAVSGYRDAAITVSIPEGSEEEQVIRVPLEREWKDGRAVQSRLPHIVMRMKYDLDGRGKATEALISMGEAAVPALLKLVSDGDSKVRFHAVFALGRIEPVQDSVVSTLVRVLKGDKSYGVRYSAASALGDIGPAASAAECHSAIALGKIGPVASGAVPVLRELCEVADENLQMHAGEALAQIEGGTK
jgi:hypothetical protein